MEQKFLAAWLSCREQAASLGVRLRPLSGDAILGRALSSPDILVYILTIVAPLCVALVLFCLVDLWLRRKGGK